jgi:FMN-dependent NADH-azoreductase
MLQVDHLDLWSERLPEFDGHALEAKYARIAGTELSPEQAAAWSAIVSLIDRLAASDAVLVSTPLWNFSIPYKLKHYLDLVTQPGLTFSFDPARGYSPLLKPRPSLVILASAGDYSEGDSFGRPDLATGYLKAALSFIGLTDTTVVAIGPTLGPPARVSAGRDRAGHQLREAAAPFLAPLPAGEPAA